MLTSLFTCGSVVVNLFRVGGSGSATAGGDPHRYNATVLGFPVIELFGYQNLTIGSNIGLDQ